MDTPHLHYDMDSNLASDVGICRNLHLSIPSVHRYDSMVNSGHINLITVNYGVILHHHGMGSAGTIAIPKLMGKLPNCLTVDSSW